MLAESRRAVFLDRDGVVNEACVRNGRPGSPQSVAEVHIVRGAAKALESLSAAGYLLLGATNQPDVARGSQTRDIVEAINSAILTALPLEAIFTCYHDDADSCDCRKPKPGLLLQAAGRYSIDLRKSFMIGDRWKDVEAGRRAGCTTILLGKGYGEQSFPKPPDCQVESLSEAVSWILDR